MEPANPAPSLAARWTPLAGVASGIRRNTETRILLLETLVVLYSFTAGAFTSNPPSILDDPAGLARLAIPAIAALFGLLLRDAYAGPADRPPHASAVDAILAFALAFLSEAVLSVLKPDLVMPRWAPTQGGFVGFSLVVASRSLFPPCAKLARNVSSIPSLEVRWRAEELGRRTGQTARMYIAASGLFGSIAVYFMLTAGPKARAASCLVLTGTMYLAYQIHKRGSQAPVSTYAGVNVCLDSYRADLQRHHAFLRRASYWYYGSLLPGALLSLLGYPVYLYWLPLVILMGAELNHRAARRLRHELDELDASDAL